MKTYSQLSDEAKDVAIGWYQTKGKADRVLDGEAEQMAHELHEAVVFLADGWGSLPDFGGIYLKASLRHYDRNDVDYIIYHAPKAATNIDFLARGCGHHYDVVSEYQFHLSEHLGELREAMLARKRCHDAWVDDYYDIPEDVRDACERGEADIVRIYNEALDAAESAMEGCADHLEYYWTEYFEEELGQRMRFRDDGRPYRVWDVRK